MQSIDHDPDSESHCENCVAPRCGRYCHICGQALASSRYVRTGVLEPYWHVIDRVFRTLHDLLWPGREGGATIPIGPVTFSVVKSPDRDAERASPEAGSVTMAAARTLAEVESLRDELLHPVQQQLAALPIANIAERNTHIATIRNINRNAGCRAARLQTDRATATEGMDKRKPGEDARIYGNTDCSDYQLRLFGDMPWNIETNPLAIPRGAQFPKPMA